MNVGKKGFLALLLLVMGSFVHASQSEMDEGLTYISDKQADEQAAAARNNEARELARIRREEAAEFDSSKGYRSSRAESTDFGARQDVSEEYMAQQARDAALRALDGLARLVDAEHNRLMELGLLGRAKETLDRAAQEIKQGYQKVNASLAQSVEDYYDKQPDPAKARAAAEERKKKVREWKEKAVNAGNQVKEMLGIKSKL